MQTQGLVEVAEGVIDECGVVESDEIDLRIGIGLQILERPVERAERGGQVPYSPVAQAAVLPRERRPGPFAEPRELPVEIIVRASTKAR